MRSWRKVPLFLVAITLLLSSIIFAVNQKSQNSKNTSTPEISNYAHYAQTSEYQTTQNIKASEDDSDQVTENQNHSNFPQQEFDIASDMTSGPPLGTEVITRNNSNYVGQDLQGSVTIVADGEALNLTAEVQIPDNNYFTAVEEGMLPPRRIDAIALVDENAPTIIMYNGAMAVFTQAEGTGWELGSSDTIRISYNCYPTESGTSQPFLIGYIKDGICYGGDVYKESSGTWEFECDSDGGVYNFYFLSAASEYLSFQSITIEVV